MSQRIKGQETTLAFTSPQGDVENLGDVKTWDAELDIAILQEGYIGETADRFDDIYNGTKGSCELHIEAATWFRFTELVQDRSTRRSPASGKFSVTGVFNFPNGERARLTFEDVFWGPMPLRVPARGEYVTVSLSWACSRVRRVL